MITELNTDIFHLLNYIIFSEPCPLNPRSFSPFRKIPTLRSPQNSINNGQLSWKFIRRQYPETIFSSSRVFICRTIARPAEFALERSFQRNNNNGETSAGYKQILRFSTTPPLLRAITKTLCFFARRGSALVTDTAWARDSVAARSARAQCFTGVCAETTSLRCCRRRCCCCSSSLSLCFFFFFCFVFFLLYRTLNRLVLGTQPARSSDRSRCRAVNTSSPRHFAANAAATAHGTYAFREIEIFKSCRCTVGR